MSLTDEQVAQLLKPIHPSRVLKDQGGNSHVSQQDVTAHLTRIFGFEGWDKEIVVLEQVYEKQNPKNQQGGSNKPLGWDACYRARVKLTIRDNNGDVVKVTEDGSTGLAENQRSLGDAHDLAMKSAISLATKRAAKDLGDQFGLSLYNKGQMTALVKAIVGRADIADVQEGVEQQVSMGMDETEPTPEQTTAQDDLRAWATEKELDLQAIADKFKAQFKTDLKSATPEDVKAFQALLESGTVTIG